MEILKAIIFGIVEGITEWLPISSTGHMIILDEFLKLSVTEEFKNLFLVVIQLGAIMAVVIIFGIALLVIERRNQGSTPKVTSMNDLSYSIVFWIGMFQLIAAIFPGTSRSGATIVGALLLGVSRSVASEFTFCLAVPVMFGASFLKIIKYDFHFTGM